MQRATLGKSGSEAAGYLQGQIGNDGCYSIYFDSSTTIRLSGSIYKFSNDDTWACWCIILQKRAGTDKMDYRMFRRKYLFGCLGKLGEVSKQQ